jgi:hypothetical protein
MGRSEWGGMGLHGRLARLRRAVPARAVQEMPPREALQYEVILTR